MDPEDSYWRSFPFKELPTSPTTKVDTVKLTKLLYERKHLLKQSEWERGMKAIHNLKYGAPSHQKIELPAVMCKNSDSAVEYGKILSDTIATWIEEGFVSGPFFFHHSENLE